MKQTVERGKNEIEIEFGAGIRVDVNGPNGV